jgi:hypothetical protein
MGPFDSGDAVVIVCGPAQIVGRDAMVHLKR